MVNLMVIFSMANADFIREDRAAVLGKNITNRISKNNKIELFWGLRTTPFLEKHFKKLDFFFNSNISKYGLKTLFRTGNNKLILFAIL